MAPEFPVVAPSTVVLSCPHSQGSQICFHRSQLVTPGGGQEMGTGGNPGTGYVVGLVGRRSGLWHKEGNRILRHWLLLKQLIEILWKNNYAFSCGVRISIAIFGFTLVLHFHSSAHGEEGIIKQVFGLIWSTATLNSLQMIKTLPQKGTFILWCGVWIAIALCKAVLF